MDFLENSRNSKVDLSRHKIFTIPDRSGPVRTGPERSGTIRNGPEWVRNGPKRSGMDKEWIPLCDHIQSWLIYQYSYL